MSSWVSIWLQSKVSSRQYGRQISLVSLPPIQLLTFTSRVSQFSLIFLTYSIFYWLYFTPVTAKAKKGLYKNCSLMLFKNLLYIFSKFQSYPILYSLLNQLRAYKFYISLKLLQELQQKLSESWSSRLHCTSCCTASRTALCTRTQEENCCKAFSWVADTRKNKETTPVLQTFPQLAKQEAERTKAATNLWF